MKVLGYDYGRPDMDLPHNIDSEAFSPVGTQHARVDSPFVSPAMEQPQQLRQWYYSNPVAVTIPEDLQPLPRMLLENNMNLLYYAYFVNYTSKILVTHECETNPFRTILPRLALEDENLLSLLLAYAACHRARLLCHPEPINRIATLVSHVFPNFRRALSQDEPISDALFGTCVMLTSLTLSFPLAFDLPLSWQEHLSMAKSMCKLRVSQRHRPRTTASIFFARWFGYLDTFGSLSGHGYEGCYRDWSSELLCAEQDPRLRCLVGFTNSSLILLGRVAELSRTCDHERRTFGNLSQTTQVAAEQLRFALELGSLEVQHKRYDCCCKASTSSTDTFRAVNAALISTAIIVLHRRVYALPSESPLVQFSVDRILAALTRFGQQAPIEIPDIILPLFLAGCEARQLEQKQEVLRRLQRIGDVGMSQVARVRALLQDVWGTGIDWPDRDHQVFLG